MPKNTNRKSSANKDVQADVSNVDLEHDNSTPPPEFTMEQKLLVLDTWNYVKEHLNEVIIGAINLSYYNAANSVTRNIIIYPAI